MNLPIELPQLPPEWAIVGVAVVMKCWDAQGEVKFLSVYSEELNDAERHGMHGMALDDLIEEIVAERLLGDDDD